MQENTTKEENATALTEKERTVLARCQEGMDEAGIGWLHEYTFKGLNEKQVAGVIGSLVTKGFVRSYPEERDCFWIEVTPAGWGVLPNAGRN